MSTPVAGALAVTPLYTVPATDQMVWWDDTGQTWQGLGSGGVPGGSYLPLTGGTITGNLTVTGTTALQVATAATPPTADNSTRIATTAFVKAQGYVTSSGVTSITAGTGLTGGTITATGAIALSVPVSIANGGTSATTASGALTSLGAAPIANPSFTGNITESGAYFYLLGATGTINGTSTGPFVFGDQNSIALHLGTGATPNFLFQNNAGANVGSLTAAGVLNVTSGFSVNSRNVTPGQIGLNRAFPNTVPAAGNNGMMGLGYTFTPQSSGRLLVVISGSMSITANTGGTINLMYGTGTAPVRGAAQTGTAAAQLQAQPGFASAQVPAPLIAILTGLTIGTAYWFDVWIGTSTGTSTYFGLSYAFLEV